MADFEYLSRNRYFELYQGADGKKRLKSLRLIQSLHQDLIESFIEKTSKKGHDLVVRFPCKTNQVSIQFQVQNQAIHTLRHTLLAPEEYRFLKGIMQLRALLESAEQRED